MNKTENIIRVENLYKIYGKEINRAIKMKEDGADKNEINKKINTLKKKDENQKKLNR